MVWGRGLWFAVYGSEVDGLWFMVLGLCFAVYGLRFKPDFANIDHPKN